MTKSIVNLNDIELYPLPSEYAASGDAVQKYDLRMGFVAQQVGAQRLGYNITAVPPGKRAFPFHHHHINEELFLVLSGQGEVRIGEHVYPIKPHDVIACPPGDAESAHQIINTGTEELRYFCISTRLSPDVVGYPDTGRFGVTADELPGRTTPFRFIGKEGQSDGYWDGE